MLKRIVSKNNNTFLFEDIPNKIRNGIGIASGESILLSIYENDSFLFSIDINLIHYADIAIEEDPSELEKDFFEFMREKNEVKCRDC